MSLTIQAKGDVLNSDSVCSECGEVLPRFGVHLFIQAMGFIRDPHAPMAPARYQEASSRRMHLFKCAWGFFAKAEAFGAPRNSYLKAFAKRKPKDFTVAVAGLLSRSSSFGT
jgi:hypothetical protein